MAFAEDNDAVVHFIEEELRRSKLPKPDARRGQVDPRPHLVVLAPPSGPATLDPAWIARCGRVILVTRSDRSELSTGWPEVRAVIPPASSEASPAEQAYEYALLGTIAMHEIAAEIHRGALGAWTSVLLQPYEGLCEAELARAEAGLRDITPGDDLLGKYALRFSEAAAAAAAAAASGGAASGAAAGKVWPVYIAERCTTLAAQGTPLAVSMGSLLARAAKLLVEAGIPATAIGKTGSLARLVSVGAHQGEPLQKIANAAREMCLLEMPLVSLLAKI